MSLVMRTCINVVYCRYKRYLQSKDLSAVTSEDLDCVLGRKRSRQSSPEVKQVREKRTYLTPCFTVSQQNCLCAHVCPRVPMCAHVCPRVPTCAHVCPRVPMLWWAVSIMLVYSLVPRAVLKNQRKGPGIHCSRMRLSLGNSGNSVLFSVCYDVTCRYTS